MRTVNYKCDLCKEPRDKSDVYTVYWRSPPLPQQYVLIETLSDNVIDRQICKTCIEMIKNYELKPQTT